MARLRPVPVAIFCAVTLFIWGNRIWLAWTNDDDTVAAKLLWSLPITAFVIAALVVAVAMVAGADRTAQWFVVTVRAFAAGTIVFWAIRAPMIVLADHPLPFTIVHLVLAAVSITSAAFAWRSVGVAASNPEAPWPSPPSSSPAASSPMPDSTPPSPV